MADLNSDLNSCLCLSDSYMSLNFNNISDFSYYNYSWDKYGYLLGGYTADVWSQVLHASTFTVSITTTNIAQTWIGFLRQRLL